MYSFNPKQLFLLDAIGAVLSAFFLGVVLVKLESHIGMPRKVLYGLALPACFFAIYSFFCYFRIKKNWKPFLIGIAILNSIYCIISIVTVYFHYQTLTKLGLTYFILELAIVLIVIIIEFKTALKKLV